MRLQRRELKLKMKGPDVDLLLQELRELGHAVPPRETTFGKATQTAVRAIQQLEGLEDTGIVDERTAAAINRLLDDRRRTGRLAGTVRAGSGEPIEGARIDVLGTNLSAMSDAQGGYQVGNVPSGTVRLRATASGYAPNQASVSVGSGQTAKHDFTLNKAEEWRVRGRVVRDAGAGVAPARVIAFQVVEGESRRLGESATRDDGQYDIKYAPLTTPVDLRLQALDDAGHELGDSGVHMNVATDQPSLDIVVPAPSPADMVVKGSVRYADGRPSKGLVRAFDKDLRREEPLGESPTDGAGGYTIRYSKDRIRRAEKKGADLVVRAFSRDGQELAASPILFNAGPEATIDLVVGNEAYRGPTEYDRLVAEVAPLLDGVALAELTEDATHQDISFLSGETGQDPALLTFLATAHRLSRDTKLPAEVFYGLFRQGLPMELPGLLMQSEEVQRLALVQAAQANIIALSFAEQADAVVEQLKTLVVREAMEPRAGGSDGDTATLNDLLSLPVHETALREQFLTAYAKHSGSLESFWKDLAERPEFANQIAHIQRTLQFGALAGNHLPLVTELQRLQQAGTIAELSDLTRYDEQDWLKIITQDRPTGPIGAPPGVPGEDAAQRARNYATALSHMVEDAFPTRYVAQRLKTDDLPGQQDLVAFLDANADFDIRSTRLPSYLEAHPDALANVQDRDGTKARIRALQRVYKLAPRYAQASGLLKGGVESSQAVTRMGENVFASVFGARLGGTVQAKRVFARAQQVAATALQLAASYGPLAYGVELQVLSGSPVLEVDGVPEWSTLFGSLELCACEHCRSVYSPAAYLVDVLHFLKDRPSTIDRDGGTSTGANASSTLTDTTRTWTTNRWADGLVRVTKGKGAGQTRSVSSNTGTQLTVTPVWHTIPDATSEYVVDKIIADKKAKDILFLRRPDLGQIELTCDNTNTPLPYVDLLNEALENAVAPFPTFTPFDLPAEVEADLNNRTVSETLRDGFTPPLSTEAVITVGAYGKPWEVAPDWWTIDEPGFTYSVRKENGTISVVSRGLQTKGSAAERAANPQYLNTNAYDEVLDEAVYPWTLPFDLWTEEARSYLGHLGVPRFRIMEVFQPAARADVLNGAALAREHLGLTAAQADIITGVTMSQPGSAEPGPWNLWGFDTQTLTAQSSIPDPSDRTRRIAAGNWLTVLSGRVDVFLQQSGLTYKEMLGLLDTYYVNPHVAGARAVQIVSTDPDHPDTCETDKLKLDGFDEACATRAVQFVRLWRPVGWSMRDLDRAITAFAPGALNDDFLVRVSHVQRLHTSLDVPVRRLLSWWANLDTAFYIDHDLPGQPRAASVYDELFRNRATVTPPDPAFTDKPGDLTGALSGHGAPIAAALGVSAADLALLLPDRDVVPDDVLSLNRLSLLHRHASLAQALYLPVRDYLAALKVIGIDPFNTTTETLLFTEAVQKVSAAEATMAELDYLLRHVVRPDSPIAPTDESVATLLDQLRAGLQQLAEENTFRTDPTDPAGPTVDLNGDLTRRKLTLLNWDRPWVDQAVATLNSATTYEAALAALPDGVVTLPNVPAVYGVDLAALPGAFEMPAELSDVIAYDTGNQRLTATRFLTEPERDLLRDAAATVGDTAVTAAIATLVQMQDELRGEISYDAQRQVLRFAGPMTNQRKARLDAVSADGPYRAAVQALYDAPRRFVSRAMRTFSVHDFAADLAGLPSGVRIPKALKLKVYFDGTASPKRLHCLGVMSEQERDKLLALSADAAYRAAVNDLFDQPEALVPVTPDVFLTASGTGNDAAALFDEPTTAGDRFLRVLAPLLNHLRESLSERQAVTQVAEAVQLETRSADALLRTWLDSPVDPARRCLAELVDPGFAESNPNVPLSPAGFPGQFKCVMHVHKTALIARRFNLTHRQLGWLFNYGPTAGWLDLNALPTSAADTPASFDDWLRLADLAAVRDVLPQGERALDEILARASAVDSTAPAADKDAAKQTWRDAVLRWTQWGPADLETLLGAADDHIQSGALGVAFPDGYQGERPLVRLREAFQLLKALGMSAQLATTLTTSAVTQATARDVRQVVRAKYDEAQWLNLAKPLRDALRARQRAALVAYLVTHLKLPFTQLETRHPDLALNDSRPAVRELQRKLNASGVSPAVAIDGVFGPETEAAVTAFQASQGLTADGAVDAATWAALDTVRRSLRDANDLYAHLLIDVEMDPCMMTSRIKQAISSVQLFVQRCLMNLEPDVSASAGVDVRWREWKWMKNYRVWEANRKVFLYAENWIEPELRDDKSPFFEELESELLQSDLTLATAEEAFLHYLEKLDQVARLEVVGMYHQVERDGAGNTAVDILHVFARTPGTPHAYYYRQRVDSAHWTPWERLDLDIEGEHVLPVVWNRRLYLFWAIFTERAEPLPSTGDLAGLGSSTPQRYWEIKLAWSERKEGAWTAKRVSTRAVEHGIGFVFPSPLSSTLESRFDANNNLNVIVWYGDPLVAWQNTFRFVGGTDDPVLGKELEEGAFQLTGTRLEGMFRRESYEFGEGPLYLPAPDPAPALATTPGTFLLLPYHDGSAITEHPFFFQDDKRAFFITPSEEELLVTDGFEIDLGIIDQLANRYWRWQAAGPFPDPLDPAIDPKDPILSDLSHSVLSAGNLIQQGQAFRLPMNARVAHEARAAAGLDLLVGSSAAPPAGAMRTAARFASVLSATSAVGRMGSPPRSMLLRSSRRVRYDRATPTVGWSVHRTEYRFLFQTFYHPYVCALVRELNRNGVAGMLQRPLQLYPEQFAPRMPDAQPVPPLDFGTEYLPGPIVRTPYPEDVLDFENDGAYSAYNWELFFHAPLLIADRLSKNQRYEEAQKWFHYIFDPTDTSGLDVPQRYWRTKPFHERTRSAYEREHLKYILTLLAAGADPVRRANLDSDQQADLDRFEKGVAAWRKDPFKPHLIARTRTTAYQKAVVMKYIDNVIAWADQLFRRDTIETINEATQLYVLAAEILGRRPEDVPPRAIPRVQTYDSLEPQLDSFSNALVQIEEFVSPSAHGGGDGGTTATSPTLGAMLHFCVPKNDKLLSYWDTVSDRLFKIRHCMNIAGVVRQLPLFEPPIDPALLVRAVAAGLDLSTVLEDLSSGVTDVGAVQPHYRFNVLAQKATELCAELKSLGQAMLSALEKRDGEQISLLRAEHETTMLALAEQVRRLQRDEAQRSAAALTRSRDSAVTRYVHYQRLLGVQSPQVPGVGQRIQEGAPSQHVAIQEEGGIKTIPFEQEEIAKLKESDESQDRAAWVDFASSIAHIVPNWNVEPWGVGATFGGSNVGSALSAVANRFRADATEAAYEAGKAAKLGQYAMRAHDWLLQSNLAAREIMQIDQQILGAQLREQIAERELFNHRRQLAHAREVETFLRDKFTNRELYGWMVGQLAIVYFQTYELAYDLAKRAERAFRHELGVRDSDFIQFGYWDSLKKGLLAGERLFHDLKRMEVAYLEQNEREYEITKHISVARLDPLALLQLRQTGTCFVRLPEALFDLDLPGHYMRRIKAIGFSIPCVTGPYAGVHCTLTLLRSSVRHANTLQNGKYARGEADPRFTDALGAIESIVTSSGQNDGGLFETNLRDERFLPFEGAGAISEWQIELPAGFRQFDYDTISDVILHLRYTARDGGAPLRQKAGVELRAAVNQYIRTEGQQGLAQVFSLRHEFPGEWHRFLHPPEGSEDDQTLTMALEEDRFPFVFKDRISKVDTTEGRLGRIDAIEVLVRVKPEFADEHNEDTLKLSLERGSAVSANTVTLAPWNGLLRGAKSPAGALGTWTLTAWLDQGSGNERLTPQAIEDIALVCRYTCS